MVNKRSLGIFALFTAILLAVTLYLVGPGLIEDFSLLGKYANAIYFLAAPLIYLLIIAFVPTRESIETRNNLRYYEEEKIREHRYKKDVLDFDDVLENFCPRNFNGIKAMNLVFVEKYNCLSQAVDNLAYEALTKSGANHIPLKETFDKIFSRIEETFQNNLPTFLFVNIGKHTVSLGIYEKLKTLKQNRPEIQVFAVCSSFYFYRKAQTIETLIAEGILEKEKLSDTFFFVRSNKKVLVERIQNCLL